MQNYVTQSCNGTLSVYQCIIMRVCDRMVTFLLQSDQFQIQYFPVDLFVKVTVLFWKMCIFNYVVLNLTLT